MNLYQLGVPYLKVSADILKLPTKNAVAELLRMAGGAYVPADLRSLTPYARRQQRETLSELEHRHLIKFGGEVREPGSDTVKYALPDDFPTMAEVPQGKSVSLPINAPWSEMAISELKTYIGLFVASRSKRSPWFRFTGTHTELAQIAQITRQAVGTALKGLANKDLISLWSERDGHRWREGTHVQLNDPTSGVSLNDLAWAVVNSVSQLTPDFKYKHALSAVDPERSNFSGYVWGLKTYCPFCKGFQAKRNFRITFDEHTDLWFCSECERTGDSTKLFAGRSFNAVRHLVPNPSRLAQMTQIVNEKQLAAGGSPFEEPKPGYTEDGYPKDGCTEKGELPNADITY